MANIFKTLINFMLFYLLMSIFAPVFTLNSANFPSMLIPAFTFGIMVMLLPKIMRFMKIKGNEGTLVMGTVILMFVYFFVGHYVFELFIFKAGSIQFFQNSDLLSIEIKDQTLSLILISIFASLFSVIIQILSKKQ